MGDLGDVGQAIAEVDGGSPRRGGSPRSGASAAFLDGIGGPRPSQELSLGDSVALQEEDVRDAKGQVSALLTFRQNLTNANPACGSRHIANRRMNGIRPRPPVSACRRSAGGLAAGNALVPLNCGAGRWLPGVGRTLPLPHPKGRTRGA